VLDLSDPRAPLVKGQLKIPVPQYSVYALYIHTRTITVPKTPSPIYSVYTHAQSRYLYVLYAHTHTHTHTHTGYTHHPITYMFRIHTHTRNPPPPSPPPPLHNNIYRATRSICTQLRTRFFWGWGKKRPKALGAVQLIWG
jgi:hypothetical protein